MKINPALGLTLQFPDFGMPAHRRAQEFQALLRHSSATPTNSQGKNDTRAEQATGNVKRRNDSSALRSTVFSRPMESDVVIRAPIEKFAINQSLSAPTFHQIQFDVLARWRKWMLAQTLQDSIDDAAPMSWKAAGLEFSLRRNEGGFELVIIDNRKIGLKTDELDQLQSTLQQRVGMSLTVVTA